VTQAAVSKTIQALEENLGCALFTRSGRTIALTPKGQELYERTRSALDYLEEGCARIRAGQDETSITIVANTAVSHFWLAPRLRRYSAYAPSASVRLITSDREQDLIDIEHDVAILYGYENRLGWNQVRLFTEELVPVAKRSFLAENNLSGQLPLSPETIATLPVLDYDLRDAGWINFSSWLAWSGAPNNSNDVHRVFSNYDLAIDAMLDGQGIALASRKLLMELLLNEDVVEVSDQQFRTDRAYFLGFRSGRELRPEAQKLHQWLLQSCSD
jgi:DNA-binding transcriptional LysR family regulator